MWVYRPSYAARARAGRPRRMLSRCRVSVQGGVGRSAAPVRAGFLARCSSRRIWRLRFENTLSMTRRMRALRISAGGHLPSWWRSGQISSMWSSSMESWYSRPQKPLSADRVLPTCAAASSRRCRALGRSWGRRGHSRSERLVVGDQHQSYPPDELALRGAVAVAGVAGKFALRCTAG